MFDFLKSVGIVPDILMGKDPKKALEDNLKAGAVVGGTMLGLPALAGASGATAAGTSAAAGAPGAAPGTGILDSLMGGLKTANEYAKPVAQAAGYAQQAAGILGGGQQPMQAPPAPMGGGQSVAAPIQGILDSQSQLEQERQAAIRRRSAGILGSTYG